MVDSFSDFFIVPGYIPIMISMILGLTIDYTGPLFFLFIPNARCNINDESITGDFLIFGFDGQFISGSSIWWGYLEFNGHSIAAVVF